MQPFVASNGLTFLQMGVYTTRAHFWVHGIFCYHLNAIDIQSAASVDSMHACMQMHALPELAGS